GRGARRRRGVRPLEGAQPIRVAGRHRPREARSRLIKQFNFIAAKRISPEPVESDEAASMRHVPLAFALAFVFALGAAGCTKAPAPDSVTAASVATTDPTASDAPSGGSPPTDPTPSSPTP